MHNGYLYKTVYPCIALSVHQSVCQASKKINFNKRRPTEYRFNKNVKLPNAMSTNKEFECEIRKREFYSAFKKYKRITGKKNNKSMGSSNRIINLEPRLIEGVNSLQKRIKSGEIIITSTDKSS